MHYENNSPFLTITSMTRVIEVSHWGNIAVEETVDLKHTGAVLKGPFSRYDYQRQPDSGISSVKSFKVGILHHLFIPWLLPHIPRFKYINKYPVLSNKGLLKLSSVFREGSFQKAKSGFWKWKLEVICLITSGGQRSCICQACSVSLRS